jgi:maltose-binding protein MalE
MSTVKWLFLMFLVSGIVGCTPYQATLTNEEQSYSATTTEKVQVFLQGDKIPPAKELGSIVVSGNSEKHGVEFLREQAAKMGADAVINLEVQIQTQTLVILFIPIPIHSYFVSGTAVKYIN